MWCLGNSCFSSLFGLCCTTVLLLQHLPALTSALTPTYFVAAPNVIRVGVNETVVIHIFGDVGDTSIPVQIEMKDHPARSTTYATQTVDVFKNVPESVSLQVRPGDVAAHRNPLEPQYVDLLVTSTSPRFSFSDQATILLSFKAGYVFLQTDKPVYTPNQEVKIRLISVNQQMRPSQEKIRLDILTPHGIIVERYDDLDPSGGFVSKTFQFPSSPLLGNWSAVAYYGHQLWHNSTIEFLVKEYVLPTFYVNITSYPSRGSDKTYILPSDTHVSTLVAGKYVFKKNVQGLYRIRYSLLDPDGHMELVKDGINGTLNEHGEFVQTLPLSDILGSKSFNDFVGKRLHIEAFIVESATGKVESANSSLLKFVDTPFVFKWDQTLTYFKKDLAFEVKIDLLDHNGDPVRNIDVTLNARSDGGNLLQPNTTKTTNNYGRSGFSLNVPFDTNRIDIWMTTNAGGDLAGFEKTDSFSVAPFDRNGDSDLLIQPKAQVQNEISLDPNGLSVSLQITNQMATDVLFLFVVAGGRIMQPQAEEVIEGTTFDVDLTHDMVPSARLVGFYVNNANRLIADSLWIDVADQCENPIEIIVPVNDGKTYFGPGDAVRLNLASTHPTKVGLLAVDSAVYLVQDDYHRLNKKKMFAKMAAYDLGCGPGGGRDTADIFRNAGVTVLTNSIYSERSQKREGLHCEPDSNRIKRAIEESLEELLQLYNGNDTLTKWCERGTTFIDGWSCLERARGLMNRQGRQMDDPIVQALYKCCLAVMQATARSSGRGGPQPDIKIDLHGLQVRSYFPESWLFRVEESGPVDIHLPDSITTWIIQGVGVSPLFGMCVADHKEIVVRRDIFLDISLPYSVKRFEQVAIIATVYNFRSEELETELRMRSIDGLCCNVRTDSYEEGRVMVPANGAASHTFVVIPLEVKDFNVEIYMFSRRQDDAVRKILHVVHDGVQQKNSRSVILNPAGQSIESQGQDKNSTVDEVENLRHTSHLNPANRIQQDIITVTMPGDALPGTSNCKMSVIGGLLGPVANASVDGLNAESLLILPYGCPEQTMSSFSPNVYIYNYVKNTNQMTSSIEGTAHDHIRKGITRSQQYVKPDGSYGYANRPGQWLAAFALKVFCQASEFVHVDVNLICNGIQWLTTQQNPDGSFIGSRYSYTHVEHTAFIVIALSECTCGSVDTNQLVSKATMYLEGQLQSIADDVETLAIVTYALALVNSRRKDDANSLLKELGQEGKHGGKFFGPSSSNAKAVETTGYALLAQVTLNEITDSYPIVVWLAQQRNALGTWWSTQDTVIGLQALAQYAETAELVNTDLNCDVTSNTDNTFRKEWSIDSDNLLVLQAAKVGVNDELVIDTNGVGIATLSVDFTYNTASSTGNNCPFEIVIKPKDKEPVQVQSADGNANPKAKMEIEVCARYLEGNNTNMAIIDVELLSGFSAVKESLIKARDESPLIEQFEVADRRVIFYADTILGGAGVEPLCVSFEAQQDKKVGNVQPAPVKVYDYYLPDKNCIMFYGPENESPLLATICEGNACVCAASRCYSNRTTNRTQPQAPLVYLEKACSGIEYFAYNATLVTKEMDSTFEIFTMYIEPVKNGLDSSLEEQGGLRKFLKSRNCKLPDFLEINRRYLIIGRMDRKYSGDFSRYKYIIDEEFDIIDWPPLLKDCKAACSNDACKQKCNDSPWQGKKQRKFFRDIKTLFEAGCQQ